MDIHTLCEIVILNVPMVDRWWVYGKLTAIPAFMKPMTYGKRLDWMIACGVSVRITTQRSDWFLVRYPCISLEEFNSDDDPEVLHIEWTLCGLLHSFGLPAIDSEIQCYGTKQWFKHGVDHRIDGPSCICKYRQYWMQDGEYYRDDDLPSCHYIGNKYEWNYKKHVETEPLDYDYELTFVRLKRRIPYVKSANCVNTISYAVMFPVSIIIMDNGVIFARWSLPGNASICRKYNENSEITSGMEHRVVYNNLNKHHFASIIFAIAALLWDDYKRDFAPKWYRNVDKCRGFDCKWYCRCKGKYASVNGSLTRYI